MRVEHFGYLGAVRDTKDKSNRNLELLERQVAEGVDNPFLHFNLGSEYAAVGERHPRADALRARLDHRPRRRARQQRRLRAGAGLALRPRAAQRRPPGRRRDGGRRGPRDLPRLHRHRPRAGARRRRGRRRRAPGGAAAPLPGDGRRAEPLLGDRRLRHLPRRSWSWPTSCAAAAPWRRPRRRCATACASTPASWPPSTPTPRCCCAAASPPAEVVETVHALVADSSPSMRFLLAVALSEAGAVAEAEAELRAVVAAQPANAHARVALAETLLAQGRFADAAAEAAAVDPEAPCAAAAQRTELFALLTDGTPADARAARRAARRGARRLRRLGGRALRRRRAGRAPGRRPPRPCSSCSTPSRACRPSMPSRTSWPCSRPSPCPWRERRQALAELYLRHGYADSAAEEWIAACEQGGRRRAGPARAGRRGRRPRASTRTPRCSPPRPTRWPRPDRAQVLVAPAESSDDKPGQGRPGQISRRN